MRIMLNLAECVTISLIIIGGVYYWFKVEMFNFYSVGIPILRYTIVVYRIIRGIEAIVII